MTRYLIIFLLLFCTCSKTNEGRESLVEFTNHKVPLEIFTNIDGTRTKLSSTGLGELTDWRDDEMGGFTSITPYYIFGKNNLAYYLEGVKQDQISRIKLVLNINDTSEKKEALRKLSEATEKTFTVLNLSIPKDLKESIVKEHPVVIEDGKLSIQLKIEKSKIDAWAVVIMSKL